MMVFPHNLLLEILPLLLNPFLLTELAVLIHPLTYLGFLTLNHKYLLQNTPPFLIFQLFLYPMSLLFSAGLFLIVSPASSINLITSFSVVKLRGFHMLIYLSNTLISCVLANEPISLVISLTISLILNMSVFSPLV